MHFSSVIQNDITKYNRKRSTEIVIKLDLRLHMTFNIILAAY